MRFRPVLIAGALIASAASAQTGNPGGAINDRLGNVDYGVCRGIDPVCYHDWSRAATEQYRILIYSRTVGPRHAGLGTPLPAGLNPALADNNAMQRAMLKIAADNGWTADYTEDVEQFRNLSGYNAVVFLSTTRETLDDNGKTALRQYMRAGGGFVGIHNAFGTLYNWPYYEGLLGGANFYNHGPLRGGEVVMVNRSDASTARLPARWTFRDEWYNLVPFPSNVRFLATVDETSWTEEPAPQRTAPATAAAGTQAQAARPRQLASVVGQHPGHGSFHPVAWCHYYDGGKAWLTTLGHDAAAFDPRSGYPGAQHFHSMLVGGIKSVIGQEPFCR